MALPYWFLRTLRIWVDLSIANISYWGPRADYVALPYAIPVFNLCMAHVGDIAFAILVCCILSVCSLCGKMWHCYNDLLTFWTFGACDSDIWQCHIGTFYFAQPGPLWTIAPLLHIASPIFFSRGPLCAQYIIGSSHSPYHFTPWGLRRRYTALHFAYTIVNP